MTTWQRWRNCRLSTSYV